VIIGFNTSVEPAVRQHADDEGVEIRLYAVIYQLLDDLRAALEGMLEPEHIEQVLGNAEVLEIFAISGVGKIAAAVQPHDARIETSRAPRRLVELRRQLTTLKRHRRPSRSHRRPGVRHLPDVYRDIRARAGVLRSACVADLDI